MTLNAAVKTNNYPEWALVDCFLFLKVCGMLISTSLGHLMKNRGTTSTMQLNVTQNTTSLWNTERSPRGRKKKKKKSKTDIRVAYTCQPERKTVLYKGHQLTVCFVVCLFLPSGVKKMMDATRKPRTRPMTTTQPITEPNRHQVITRTTPPTTPIRAVRANRTARTDRRNKMTSCTTVSMYHSS